MPGGGTAIVCGDFRAAPCVVCGKPSTRLCDHVIDDDGHTCDAALCEKHAFHPLVNGVPIFGRTRTIARNTPRRR
jgi:hypothetical protein